MYETKTVLRTWYELGWFEGWELYGYTEFDCNAIPKMAEIRRPISHPPDAVQYTDNQTQIGDNMADKNEKDTSNATKVLKCTCQHEFQDRKYGAGMRVHNYARSANGKTGGWRCTVCKATKSK